MPNLDCESQHPGIGKGMASGRGRTTGNDDKSKAKAVDAAESEAVNKAFEDAMDELDDYVCKDPCERRFRVSFQTIRRRWKLPHMLNGDKEYEVVVTVQWTLDIGCKRPSPGGSLKYGRLK